MTPRHDLRESLCCLAIVYLIFQLPLFLFFAGLGLPIEGIVAKVLESDLWPVYLFPSRPIELTLANALAGIISLGFFATFAALAIALIIRGFRRAIPRIERFMLFFMGLGLWFFFGLMIAMIDV